MDTRWADEDDSDIEIPLQWLQDAGYSSDSSEPEPEDLRSWADVVAGNRSANIVTIFDAPAASAEPGDPIGIRAMQSILMSATQTSLSHFHTAGMASGATSGVRPSPAEAMDSVYTGENTAMRFRVGSVDVKHLRRHMVGATLGSFVLTVGSSFAVLPERENLWYEILNKPMNNDIMRMYIDSRRMLEHGLTLDMLARGAFGSDCSWNVSPDFMGMIDVEISGVHMSSWLSRMEASVCGTPNIKSCNLANDVAVTRGTNMLAAARTPGVDRSTIMSNNVCEVEGVLGVEAAVGVLTKLVGSRIVSDFMARTGTVLPFSKRSKEIHGKGLLTSMGFERPKEDIKDAVMNSTGILVHPVPVYESIMTGLDPSVGFDVIVP